MSPTLQIKQYSEFVKKIQEKNLFRQVPTDQNNLIDFSSNDYLNFSQNPNLIHANCQAAQSFGVGSKAARLLSYQNQEMIFELENQIAIDKGSESALVLNTGYSANLSIIATLLDQNILKSKPLIFADKLNHASIHQGIQLAGAKQIRYRHLDLDHLNWLLNKYSTGNHPKFIMSESIFGMDGDQVNLEKLIEIAKNHNAFLYLDEAHATGLWGKNGYGLSSDFPGEVDLSLGTFSKALGCFGAYISCQQEVKTYLMNRCPGFIYTTMPPPTQIATMYAAWQEIPRVQPQVQQMRLTAQEVKNKLKAMGWKTTHSESNIIPILVPDAKTCLDLKQKLAQHQIGVSAIRPPSVLPNGSRIRIALNLSHQEHDIQKLLFAFNAVGFRNNSDTAYPEPITEK